jgi:hypothetical protein
MPGTAYGSPSDKGRLRCRSCTNELFTPAVLTIHGSRRSLQTILDIFWGLKVFQGRTFTIMHPNLQTKVFGTKEGKEICL